VDAELAGVAEADSRELQAQPRHQGGHVVLDVPGGEQHHRHHHDLAGPLGDQVGAGDRQWRRRQLDEPAGQGGPRVEGADPVGQGEQLDRAGGVLAAVPRHQQGRPVHAGSGW
jgi:hypothetical protein